MISAFIALLLATAPLPAFLAQLDEKTGDDLACVILLGFAQGAVEDGREFARVPPDLDERGRRWTGLVLTRVEAQTGFSEEELSDRLGELVAPELEKLRTGSEAVHVRQARVDSCLIRLDAGLRASD